MNERTKDQFENTGNNLFENKLFRKNAFKEENNLLPKSLLKDLIEDEYSSGSPGDSPIKENNSFYPKDFDSDRDNLENKATNDFTNYDMEEQKFRASTFDEIGNARKGLKIAESFGTNTKNKLFKVQSCNDHQNFSRPQIANFSHNNTINNNLNNLGPYNSTINVSKNNSGVSINNNLNNNMNNNNNYFNSESRNFCEEQNYMGNNPAIGNKQINNNNMNIPNMSGKVHTFNSICRASSVSQNTANNFHSNISQQKPMNNNSNMRFNPISGRNNFSQQASPNNNNFSCLGSNSNCRCNNCFSGISPNNYGGCNISKNVINQICLCPNCNDDTGYIDENSCGYHPSNMINVNNNFNNNCMNSYANMVGGPQQHNNFMNYNSHLQQFAEKSNLNHCRTYCNMNVNHPNIGLGNGIKILLILFLNNYFVILSF